MKKLYEFCWDFHRMGQVEGLFVADEDRVKRVVGQQIYFGEILGKHSEIFATLEEDDLVVKSVDQEFIEKLVEIMGSETISGYNPITTYENRDYEEDDDE